MNKTALTELPLSPEESYHASQLFGRSLFSALQLAKEQEFRKNLEAKKMYSNEDERVLNIPIPAHLMPSQKIAAEHLPRVSIIEHPDGSLEHKVTRPEPPESGEHRHSNRNLGAVIGAGTGGFSGALAGGAAGAVLDSGPGHEGMKYSKTIKHLDGTQEHVFELARASGVGEHFKRNMGKYLGTAAGATLGKALPGALKKLVLPLAGLSAGHAFDKYNKATDLEQEIENPYTQQDMLADVQFRKKMLANKTGEDHSVFQRAFSGVANHPVRMLVGGQSGFRDAKKDFYFKQKEQIQKELMEAQKDYIDLLSRIKTGAAEEYDATPCVDAFCNGIAHTTLFGKTATFRNVNIEDDAISRLMHDVAHTASKPFRPAADYAATGLMGTAAGSAYLTYLLRKKMREEPDNYMAEHLPTRVELQPYH